MKNITYLRRSHSAAFSCAWQGWHIFHRFGNKRCCKRYFCMMAPQSGKNHERGIRILKSYTCHPVCNIGYFWSCPVSWVGDLWVQTDFSLSCGVGRPSPFRTTPVSSKHGRDLELLGWIAVWDCHVRLPRVCGLWSHMCLCFHLILGNHSAWIGASWHHGRMERRRICWPT